jgi:cobalamin synthase
MNLIVMVIVIVTIPSTQWMDTWNFVSYIYNFYFYLNIFNLKVHPFLYSFIPFTLIAISNMLLLLHLNKLRKNSTTTVSSPLSRKQFEINVTIMVITILFIIFTSPGAVISQFYSALVVSENGNIVIYVGDCFTFSFIMRLQLLFLATNKNIYRV